MIEKFSFDDILLMSSKISTINSRSDVNPYNTGYLPLFTAPMLDVVDKNNYKNFEKNKIHSIIPRTKDIEEAKQNIINHNDVFVSLSLNQFETLFSNQIFRLVLGKLKIKKVKILIDIANGHMDKLVGSILNSKLIWGDNLLLMVGNISNPDTFKVLSNAGADYIRCGVGSGAACLTSNNTAIGYPQASLIKDIYDSVKDLEKRAFIISDGGHKSYSDIIKALALGADYVMLGSQFSQLLESSGDNYFLGLKINNTLAKKLHKKGFKITKIYRGMSTKSAQKIIGDGLLKTEEGTIKKLIASGTIEKWAKEFEDALRSTMSYANAKLLSEFKGKVNFNFITETSYKRLIK